MRNIPAPLRQNIAVAEGGGGARVVLMIRVIEEEVQSILADRTRVLDIAAAARALLSFRLVAQQELPDSFKRDEKTATNIVASVLQETLDEDEYRTIAGRNQEAGQARGLAAGRKVAGIVEWPDAERARLAELALIHRHQSGRQRGRPDCDAIAGVINAEFHGGKPKRTRQATAAILIQLYKEGLTLPEDGEVDLHPWSPEEDARFEELMATLVHPAGHQHEGSPDFNLIALALNEEFYPEQTDEGEGVRTGTTCNKHAAIIRKRKKKAASETGQEAAGPDGKTPAESSVA
jgi:hypothetical protein